MTDETAKVEELVHKEYEHGFVTDIDTDTVAPGLDEEVIALISARKEEPEWLLEWRLDAFRRWTRMAEPGWAHVHYPPIDYQAISYYSAPKAKTDGPKSLDEVDPKLLETYEKLGIPLHEQKMLAGVAVDAVFDSVSVATTFKENWRTPVWFSVRSPRRCRTTPTWCGNTWAASSRSRTTIMQP